MNQQFIYFIDDNMQQCNLFHFRGKILRAMKFDRRN